jgi:hypothetical protein
MKIVVDQCADLNFKRQAQQTSSTGRVLYVSPFDQYGFVFSVLMVALIFSLSLAGVAPAQTNTSLGTNALASNTIGANNTAIGFDALLSNTTGNNNTATGLQALFSNTTGIGNTAIGFGADVSTVWMEKQCWERFAALS